MSERDDTTPDPFGGMSREERRRLGLVVDPATPPSLEDVAEMTGTDPAELRAWQKVRNATDAEQARREVAAFRQARQEAEANAIRRRVLDREREHD